jgi:acyl-CoA thioester hydrolase
MTYLDVAVTEYLREVIGPDWLTLADQHIFDIALVKTTLEFKKPAKLDDWLDIHCRVSRIGNSSFTVSFAITREGKDGLELILTAETVYVNFNVATGKAQPLPPEIRAKFCAYEGLAQL